MSDIEMLKALDAIKYEINGKFFRNDSADTLQARIDKIEDIVDTARSALLGSGA